MCSITPHPSFTPSYVSSSHYRQARSHTSAYNIDTDDKLQSDCNMT